MKKKKKNRINREMLKELKSSIYNTGLFSKKRGFSNLSVDNILSMIALFLYQTKYYHKTEIFLNKNQSKALSLWNQCYLRC